MSIIDLHCKLCQYVLSIGDSQEGCHQFIYVSKKLLIVADMWNFAIFGSCHFVL